MKHLILIVIVVALSIIANLPSQFHLFGQKYYRPSLDLFVLGRRFYRDLNIKLGLDLQGGTHLVYEADMAKIAPENQAKAIDSAKQNIERRVNSLGVSEPIILTSKVNDKYRLIVELASITDVQQALDLIGQTAQLDFRETTDATPSAQSKFTPTGLTGSDLKLAQVQFGTGTTPSVGIEFSPEGAKKFSEITARNVGKPLAIYLDDKLVTAPTVNTVISDGKASITGTFTLDEVKLLTIQLNAGALPIPIKVVEQRSIGATLGHESIVKSVIAGGVGLLLVWLFMLANYGRQGLVANLALLIYVLLSMAIVRLVPITLTLAGIAGLILSVGMAVDANILIFERIKEERRWGRPLASAIELGFHRAWTSIRDSNASTLITSAILFWFGSGPVRGFALTLAVGVLASLFTAVWITQFLLKVMYRTAK